MTITFFKKQFIIFLTILSIFTNNIAYATILSISNNTGLTDKLNLNNPNTFTDKLKESAVSNITSTAVQSTVNGDSFTESLKQQLINTIVMAGADYGANKIGELAHGTLDIDDNGNIIYTEPQINKGEQLFLHALLGATANELTGNDAMNGAISGVLGEITGDYLKNKGYDKENASEIAGLVSGLSSIIVSKSQGKDVREITDNAYSGQRIGKNASENNAFFVNKNKKAIDVIDDGDYNAYQVDNDVTKEDIEQNPEKYKEENILYSDLFLNDGDNSNELAGKDLTLIEQLFSNEEVHNELLLLNEFDRDKSILDNVLSSNSVDDNVLNKISKIYGSGIELDDYSLSAVLTPNLYNYLAILNNNGLGGNNPTKTIANIFDLKINDTYTALPVIGGEARGSTGCKTANCGDIGALRKGGGRPHFGTDILGKAGDWVIAGRDGTVTKTTTRADKGTMNGINLKTDDGYIQTLYVKSNVKDNTKVKQGDIIGNVEDLNNGYNNVINHSHVEVFDGYENGNIRKKSNHQDSNKIFVPNRKNPYGIEIIRKYQQNKSK